MYEKNQMENYPSVDLYRETKTEERKNLQRKVATKPQILLKNDDGIIPLNISKIAIIGYDAFEQDCDNASDCKCKNETNEDLMDIFH